MAQKSKDRRSVEVLAALLPAGVASLSIGLAAADANASTAVTDSPNTSKSVAARLEAIRGSVSEAWKQALQKSVTLCRGRPRNQARLVGQWRLAERRLAQLGQRRLAQLG